MIPYYELIKSELEVGKEYKFLYKRSGDTSYEHIKVNANEEKLNAFIKNIVENYPNKIKNIQSFVKYTGVLNESKESMKLILDKIKTHKKDCGIARWNAYQAEYPKHMALKESCETTIEMLKEDISASIDTFGINNKDNDTSPISSFFKRYSSVEFDINDSYEVTATYLGKTIDSRNGKMHDLFISNGARIKEDSFDGEYMEKKDG